MQGERQLLDGGVAGDCLQLQVNEGMVGGLAAAGADVDVDTVRPGATEGGGFRLVGVHSLVRNVGLAVHRDAARIGKTGDGLQGPDRNHRHGQA